MLNAYSARLVLKKADGTEVDVMPGYIFTAAQDDEGNVYMTRIGGHGVDFVGERRMHGFIKTALKRVRNLAGVSS